VPGKKVVKLLATAQQAKQKQRVNTKKAPGTNAP